MNGLLAIVLRGRVGKERRGRVRLKCLPGINCGLSHGENAKPRTDESGDAGGVCDPTCGTNL